MEKKLSLSDRVLAKFSKLHLSLIATCNELLNVVAKSAA